MLDFSYNLSAELKDSLQKIENLRRQIILIPLPQKAELRFRWEALVDRLYWTANLEESKITKAEIIRLLTKPNIKTKEANEILGLKQALDSILYNWYVTNRAVTSRVISDFEDSLSMKSKIREQDLKTFLDYIQTKPESPVVQAGVSYIYILLAASSSKRVANLAGLCSYIFLYKNGYDVRGLLCLEEYFRRDLGGFRDIAEKSLRGKNFTLWLEYFAEGMRSQLEKTYKDISSNRFHLEIPAKFFDLSDRQKEIISAAQEPGLKMTNRKVQKQFKVSQITASRDLAKLASLGLLLSNGRGRSVYYTKA